MWFDFAKSLLLYALIFLMEISPLFATEKSAVNLCKKNIDRIEKDLILPLGLLEAIALTESGRHHKETSQFVAWPWTLNVDGKPEYHQTKTEALKALEGHLRNGITNIDVGCMQINYRHHGSQFKSPAYMLDPRRNVVYAGHFLNQLNQRFQSWTKSIGFYHSATLKYQVPYRQKVYKLWRQIQANDALSGRKNFGVNGDKPRWLESVLGSKTDQNKQKPHPNEKKYSPLVTASTQNINKPSFVLETDGKWIVVKMNPNEQKAKNYVKENFQHKSLEKQNFLQSSPTKLNQKSKPNTTSLPRSNRNYQTLDDILSNTKHPNQIEYQKPRVLSEVQ